MTRRSVIRAFWMARPKEEKASPAMSISPADKRGDLRRRCRGNGWARGVALAIMLEDSFFLEEDRRQLRRADRPALADIERARHPGMTRQNPRAPREPRFRPTSQRPNIASLLLISRRMRAKVAVNSRARGIIPAPPTGWSTRATDAKRERSRNAGTWHRAVAPAQRGFPPAAGTRPRYTDDMVLPRPAVLYVLRSPHCGSQDPRQSTHRGARATRRSRCF